MTWPKCDTCRTAAQCMPHIHNLGLCLRPTLGTRMVVFVGVGGGALMAEGGGEGVRMNIDVGGDVVWTGSCGCKEIVSQIEMHTLKFRAFAQKTQCLS